MRLHDRILLGGWRDQYGTIDGLQGHRVLEKFIPVMQQAKVIVADNVADYALSNMRQYVHDIGADGQETVAKIDYSQFNCAPPFRNFMLSVKAHSGANIPFLEWVIWASSWTLEEIRTLSERHVGEDNEHGSDKVLAAMLRDNGKWYCRYFLFVDLGHDDPPMLAAIYSAFIDEDGRAHHSVYSFPGRKERLEEYARRILFGNDPEAEGAMERQRRMPDIFNTLCFAAWLAVTFMHCKNVEITEHKPDAPLSKKHQTRHGRPLSRFHTIHIEPVRKILKHEGQIEHTGIEKAMHICRGHFKDYRQRGLFGSESHKGVYFWPDHVRGKLERGLVTSQYDVKAAKA